VNQLMSFPFLEALYIEATSLHIAARQ
jgi:hypothetical protein